MIHSIHKFWSKMTIMIKFEQTFSEVYETKESINQNATIPLSGPMKLFLHQLT